jgi:acyl carrier protein
LLETAMTIEPLLELIAGTLGVPPAEIIEASDMRNTRKWDSLRHMMLMTELEATYGIELTDQEMASAVSVAAIRAMLRQRGLA